MSGPEDTNAANKTPSLEIRELEAGYGSVRVLDGVSIAIERGIEGIVGANGAGKSTLLRAICGMVETWGGDILLDDDSIRDLSPPEVISRGVTIVIEGGRVFPEMTVMENLEVSRAAKRLPSDVFEAGLDLAFEAFPFLPERTAQQAGSLSGGQRQMLSVAMGIVTQPRILLLDEPSVGLSVSMQHQLEEALLHLHDSGVAMLLVDQNLGIVESLANYCHVLHRGQISWSGPPDELRLSQVVRDAVIGGDLRDL